MEGENQFCEFFSSSDTPVSREDKIKFVISHKIKEIDAKIEFRQWAVNDFCHEPLNFFPFNKFIDFLPQQCVAW